MTGEETRFWTGEHGVVLRIPKGEDVDGFAIRKARLSIDPPGEPDDGEGPRTACPLEEGEELIFAFDRMPETGEPESVPDLARSGKYVKTAFTCTFKGEAVTFDQKLTPAFGMTLQVGPRRIAFAPTDIFGIVAKVAWAGDLDGDGKLDFYIEWSTGLPGPPKRVLYLSTLGRDKHPFGPVTVR
jgi:hypothetical protein